MKRGSISVASKCARACPMRPQLRSVMPKCYAGEFVKKRMRNCSLPPLLPLSGQTLVNMQVFGCGRLGAFLEIRSKNVMEI